MRSISVWYFIKMKTGGIFYFLRRCSRCRITGTLPPAPPAAKAKAGAPLKNALYMPHSFLPTFQRCQHFVEEPLSALVRLTRSIRGKFNVQ